MDVTVGRCLAITKTIIDLREVGSSFSEEGHPEGIDLMTMPWCLGEDRQTVLSHIIDR